VSWALDSVNGMAIVNRTASRSLLIMGSEFGWILTELSYLGESKYFCFSSFGGR